MQKITPFLWYDGKAEEAVEFYSTVFSNIKVISRMGPKGAAMGVTFEIEGQQLIAFNGGPMFKFTEAVSLFVNCETQQEIDDKWEKLSAGGQKSRCGWLKDRYGLSWQIVPPVLAQLLGDPDPVKSKRVMDAMMQMDKLDIQQLKDAYDHS